MQKKVRISRKRIIAFNTRYVYFLIEDKVFRGSRTPSKKGGRSTVKETGVNLYVNEKSIKPIVEIYSGHSLSLIKILKRHGVEVVH